MSVDKVYNEIHAENVSITGPRIYRHANYLNNIITSHLLSDVVNSDSLSVQ